MKQLSLFVAFFDVKDWAFLGVDRFFFNTDFLSFLGCFDFDDELFFDFFSLSSDFPLFLLGDLDLSFGDFD